VTPDDALAWLADDPATTGIFTDFDGTLSAIVPAPEDARPVAGAVAALRQLATHFAVVAIVSGRPVEFLVAQLGLAEAGLVHAYGLHGLEHTTGDGVDLAAGAAEWRSALSSVTKHRAELEAAGVSVEDKVFGVTLHWRRAADAAAAQVAARRVADAAVADGLVSRAGKASIELLLPVGVDKGTVVGDWVGRGGMRKVMFLGDDVSDLLAFDAIDAAIRSGRVEGLKVAVTGNEAPAALVERADVLLATPEEAGTCLARLADLVQASRPTPS
jgi:trehalose 6-phosphate phosphatase